MTDDIDSLHKQIRHFFHTFATFTRDGGAAWVTTSLTDPRVSALAIDPATPAILYAGTNSHGVVKSINGGGNWRWPPPASRIPLFPPW